MDVHKITPDYCVAGQITVDDIPEIAAKGFKTVICNRPDSEIDMPLQSALLSVSAHAAGLEFVDNPISNTGLTRENLDLQRSTIENSEGPVFAYCRSGTRATICWALAVAGHIPTGNIIDLAARAGYDIAHLRGQIEYFETQS